MIYTSYYANHKNFGDAILIQISRSKPMNFVVNYVISEFMPSSDLLFKYKQGKINESVYTTRYTEQLDKYNNERYDNLINWLNSQSKDVIFLCYEGKNKFCHRHILADYLNKKSKGVLNISEL